MKKILILLLILLMSMACIVPAYAIEKELDVVYFYSSKCLACKSNKAFIANLEKIDGVNLVTYNVDEVDCSSIQVAYAQHFGVKEEGYPGILD